MHELAIIKKEVSGQKFWAEIIDILVKNCRQRNKFKNKTIME